MKEFSDMNNKNKVGILFIAVLLLFFAKPIIALGSTLLLEPTNFRIENGERIDLKVSLDPQGEDIDTVRLNLRFNADVLKLDHVQRTDYFPNTSPANVIDNEKGYLSHGAFSLSGPVEEKGLFATITFVAIHEGLSIIEVEKTSKVISNGEETFSSSSLSKSRITVLRKQSADDGVISLTTPTHPDSDQWYKENTVTFSWEVIGDVDIKEYYTQLNQESNFDPELKKDASTTSIEAVDVPDGVWYFHVKGLLADGSFTDVVTYKVQVDTTPPNAIFPYVEEQHVEEGHPLEILFGTTDNMSGIAHYGVSINDSEYEETISPLVLKNLVVGDYVVKVRATDLAGNEIFGQTTLRISPTELGNAVEILEQDEQIKDIAKTTMDEPDGKNNILKNLIIILIIIILIIITITLSYKFNNKKKIEK